MNTTNLLIKVEHYAGISKPEYLKHGNSIVITSPKKLEIEPRSDAWIDLKFNIEIESELLHTPNVWLNPSTVFATMGLDIMDKETWTMNKTKHNTIQLHLLNKRFFYKLRIKKGNIIGFAFLLGKLDSQDVKVNYHLRN